MAYSKRDDSKEKLEQAINAIEDKIQKDNNSVKSIISAFKNNENKEIRKFLINKYLTLYPEFLEYAILSDTLSDKYNMNTVLTTMFSKEKEFSKDYLRKLIKIIESHGYDSRFTDNILYTVTEIVKKNKDLSDELIERIMDIVTKYSKSMLLLNTIYSYIENNEDLQAIFLEKILENGTLLRYTNRNNYHGIDKHLLGNQEAFTTNNIINEILKSLSPIKLINLLARFNNDPDVLYFIITRLPSSPKYLKVFMYLARSKDTQVRELAKEKIKSLKV